MPENSSHQTNADAILARMVVEQGLASSQDVQDCIEFAQHLSEGPGANQRTLSDVLVSNGVVTPKQLTRIAPMIEEQKSSQQIPGYQIQKKLGQGAMATVYLAKQLSLDRPVAIKVLPRKSTSNPEFVQRFYAEGKAAAKLNHPSIVQAIDVGKAGEYHYFVMEYVEGKTVFDDIESGKKYSEKEALDIIMQVARALEHAHKAGFIHRDVKPKNIMITKEGIAKLADMGLARAATDREAAEAEQGKAYGTPYYISPEQIRGELDVDFRADIYSLGATFYHIVTGQVPFEGPNPSAVMHKHLKAQLVPPDHLNPELSAGIGEIIEVCMAKDKKKRYNSTTDLLADLEAVARGEAPLQARTKFDLSSLSQVEQSGTDVEAGERGRKSSSAALTAQPLFWAAVIGWGATLLLLILLVVVVAIK